MMKVSQPTSDQVLPLQRGPAGTILRSLQQHGPRTIKQLQAELGVRSLNAVREQLASLRGAGLINATTQRHGTGRPALVYTLSERAHALFPNGYDVLLRLLLDEIAARQGEEQVQDLLRGVGERLADQFGGHAGELQDRLDTLIQTLGARGTPITLHEAGGVTTLHKYTCPYFALAKASDAVCGVEQRMIEQVLGRDVELTERIVDGHAGCCFVVREREDAA
jgi:predicted ArsR family transcriptional regulator